MCLMSVSFICLFNFGVKTKVTEPEGTAEPNANNYILSGRMGLNRSGGSNLP